MIPDPSPFAPAVEPPAHALDRRSVEGGSSATHGRDGSRSAGRASVALDARDPATPGRGPLRTWDQTP